MGSRKADRVEQTEDKPCGPIRRLLHKLRKVVHRGAKWVGGQEPLVLISMIMLLASVLVFIELADEVGEGGTHHFDSWLLRVLRNPEHPEKMVGPPFLDEVIRDATALGGYFCLLLFTMITAGYLWLDRKRHLSQFLLGSAVSGYIVSTLLKLFFHRPRPEIVPHLDTVMSSSFPSGHSMNSAVIYLTLGTMIATSVARNRLKVYVIGVALLITLTVGISRIFLGVHYPTDVLAGWLAGLIWALACWLMAHALQQRGKVEKPVPPPDEPEDDTDDEPHKESSQDSVSEMT